MVSLTEEPDVVKPRQNGVGMYTPVMYTPILEPADESEGSELSEGDEDDRETDRSRFEYNPEYWEDDEDDVYQEFEELDFESLPDHDPDTRSIASDDSFYPPDEELKQRHFLLRPDSPENPEPQVISFFRACSNNNPVIVKVMVRQGVTEEEVKETDRNGRVGVKSGLIVACYQGYVDVVMALAQCPHIDINWQDNEGNTALMTAAQAGHIMISNYLLNYFPGLDIERRNCHGFTAMMKAAMQGRAECVRALMLSGGDVEARDFSRKITSREWALFTGRHDTAFLMERLMAQPCAEQFCDSFQLEWPMLEELVARAQEPRSRWRRFTRILVCCPFMFYLSAKVDPVDDGVLDHMVRVTTSLSSPLIAPACRTVCPGSPPCLGKRRHAVQEILRKYRLDELKLLGPERLNNYKRLFQNSRVLLVPKKRDRRASLQPQVLQDVVAVSSGAMRRASLLPLNMMRRSSVRPGIVVPKVRLCKAPSSSFIPGKAHRRRGGGESHLQIPKWNYKMKREERRQEEERQKLLLLMKKKR